ncbi:hypothetical protein MP228_010438 [Amoeboaphelidium protococcarum]|nr:hypothetical protein MP228_010438 [Amoeboaphelidium protococcarum]
MAWQNVVDHSFDLDAPVWRKTESAAHYLARVREYCSQLRWTFKSISTRLPPKLNPQQCRDYAAIDILQQMLSDILTLPTVENMVKTKRLEIPYIKLDKILYIGKQLSLKHPRIWRQDLIQVVMYVTEDELKYLALFHKDDIKNSPFQIALYLECQQKANLNISKGSVNKYFGVDSQQCVTWFDAQTRDYQYLFYIQTLVVDYAIRMSLDLTLIKDSGQMKTDVNFGQSVIESLPCLKHVDLTLAFLGDKRDLVLQLLQKIKSGQSQQSSHALEFSVHTQQPFEDESDDSLQLDSPILDQISITGVLGLEYFPLTADMINLETYAQWRAVLTKRHAAFGTSEIYIYGEDRCSEFVLALSKFVDTSQQMYSTTAITFDQEKLIEDLRIHTDFEDVICASIFSVIKNIPAKRIEIIGDNVNGEIYQLFQSTMKVLQFQQSGHIESVSLLEAEDIVTDSDSEASDSMNINQEA